MLLDICTLGVEESKRRKEEGQVAALFSLQEAEKCGLVFKKQSVICSTFLCVRFFFKRGTSVSWFCVSALKKIQKEHFKGGVKCLAKWHFKNPKAEKKTNPHPEIWRTPTFFHIA